jgi:hypothetical protein
MVILLTGRIKNKAVKKWADSWIIVPGKKNKDIRAKIGKSLLKNFLSRKKSSLIMSWVMI